MARGSTMRVAVVAGMHRVARGRTVEDLLAAVPRSVAVHHDFEEIGKGQVHRSTRDRWGYRDRRQVEPAHACASCTVREDLIPLLLRLAAQGEHDLCVVETWHSIEPQTIAEAVDAEKALTLSTVVTAVDAGALVRDLASDDDLFERGLDIAHNDDRAVAEVVARQVEYPAALVLHDRPGARRTAEHDLAIALLEQLNPAAAVLEAGASLAGPVDGRFDTAAATERVLPAWAQYADRTQGRVATVTWTRTRPLHPERLDAALEEIASLGLRGRGRIWLASRPDTLLVWESHENIVALHAAGPWMASLPEAAMDLVSDARRASASLDWDPVVGDRRQHLAFTGIDLDTVRLTTLLDSCLVTADETGTVFQADPFADVI